MAGIHEAVFHFRQCACKGRSVSTIVNPSLPAFACRRQLTGPAFHSGKSLVVLLVSTAHVQHVLHTGHAHLFSQLMLV
jgi:hypothetical protein